MQSLRQELTDIFARTFISCGLDEKFGEVTLSNRPDLAQFQCNGALAAAKAAKKNPRVIAQEVVDKLQEEKIFAELSLAGPGFINIKLRDEYLAEHLQRMTDDKRLGCQTTKKPGMFVFDYGGPNIAKPMHVGHLRASVIGDCLIRLVRFFGHDAKGDIHMGDWGTQMGMIIGELQRRQPELPYFDESYSGEYPRESPVTIAELEEMYPTAAARCKSEPEEMKKAQLATRELQDGRKGYRALWQHFMNTSLKEVKEDFASLGVEFDLWLGESDAFPRIPTMIEKLKKEDHAQESEGAWIVPIAEGEEMPPLLLVKSDGGVLYSTTDLATIVQREEDFQPTNIIYVVDGRQRLHFEQVFRVAKKGGLTGAALEHIGFGTVNGKDGKPFKTREGGVMKLKDLIDMAITEARTRMEEQSIAEDYPEKEKREAARKVGLASIKFADLKNPCASNYIFDLEKFTQFQGKTGAYLLYTIARIKSILRRATDDDIHPGALLAPTEAETRDLMLALANIQEDLERAFHQRAPHHLCEFCYTIAQKFSSFYTKHHILNEKNPQLQASWLRLAEITLLALEMVMAILGIESLERM